MGLAVGGGGVDEDGRGARGVGAEGVEGVIGVAVGVGFDAVVRGDRMGCGTEVGVGVGFAETGGGCDEGGVCTPGCDGAGIGEA